MKINLRIDYNGSPYLELASEVPSSVEDELIEFFIREGLKKGIYIENKAFNEARSDYASIRIWQRKKKPSPKDILFAENKEEEK